MTSTCPGNASCPSDILAPRYFGKEPFLFFVEPPCFFVALLVGRGVTCCQGSSQCVWGAAQVCCPAASYHRLRLCQQQQGSVEQCIQKLNIARAAKVALLSVGQAHMQPIAGPYFSQQQPAPHHRLPCHWVNASGSKATTEPSMLPAAAGNNRTDPQ